MITSRAMVNSPAAARLQLLQPRTELLHRAGRDIGERVGRAAWPPGGRGGRPWGGGRFTSIPTSPTHLLPADHAQLPDDGHGGGVAVQVDLLGSSVPGWPGLLPLLQPFCLAWFGLCCSDGKVKTTVTTFLARMSPIFQIQYFNKREAQFNVPYFFLFVKY